MIFIVLVQNNVTAVFAEPGTPENLEARGGIEPPMKVLQTFALPLGYRAPIHHLTSHHRCTHTQNPRSLQSGESCHLSPRPSLGPRRTPLILRRGTIHRALFLYFATAAAAVCTCSFTIGAPIRLPHSVHDPS